MVYCCVVLIYVYMYVGICVYACGEVTLRAMTSPVEEQLALVTMNPPLV